MLNLNDAMSTFDSVAGVSSASLSLFIRSLLCAGFFIWAAWVIYGQVLSMHHSAEEAYDVPMRILRVLFLCALMVSLVFIS